ncbi:hypothetical protein FOL47_001175, partial [Perkinsus chesapeaki]
YELHCREWEIASQKGRLSPFIQHKIPEGGFPCFGSMSDQGESHGWNVADSDRCREYLMSVYVQDFIVRQPGLAQEMRSLSGRILKGDHTRPLAGKVTSQAGAKWSYSVLNEFGEVLCHGFTETDSDIQVRQLYVGLKTRFDSLNVPYPTLAYVDKQCCGSYKKMLQEIFPNIQVKLDVFHLLWRFSKAFAKLKESPPWLYKHVRRQVPVKEELEERILAVVDAARNVEWEGELLLPPGPDGFDRCLANQVLVIDGIMRYNRNVRRKAEGHRSVYPIYDNAVLLRLRDSSGDGETIYPNLVLNATDTGEQFGLEYTAAIRRELAEAEVDELSKASPGETVADSEDIHEYEAYAMNWSMDRVLEILETEHSLQDIGRNERHVSASKSQSTSRRISKLRMFGQNSNFLQKARPENFTILMKQKLDDLAATVGEQDISEIHRQYYRWFLEEKLKDPNTPILVTSRFHVEAYLTKKKIALAGASAAVPDVMTAARRTRMAEVLASGARAVTPAVPSQSEAPRPIPRPNMEARVPEPPPEKTGTAIEIDGIRCGVCREVRKGRNRYDWTVQMD